MKTWNIDSAHSEVAFKIKHLMVSNVRGKFNSFAGSIEIPDEDLTKAVISFSAETASIDTGNGMRDGHLQSADFFNAAEFPTLTFKSKSIEKKGDDEFLVTGDFTMHGVTKEIVLPTTFNGMTSGMDGAKVMSFEILGSLSRNDFGLTWNAPIEQGGVVVSDEVKFDINAEFKEVVTA
ncbi:MAG: YceI family protein [bacterium]